MTNVQISPAPASGMRDLAPAEVAIRDWATSVIMKTYRGFGFTRIETPVMENIGLLRRGEGGENLSLIFEVLKRGEKLEKELSSADCKKENLADLGLRFDLTVPLVRFYANNQNSLPTPLKAIQMGPVFRAESPGPTRFRQFTQCDIDVIGMKSELVEMELLQATSQALLQLGFKDFTVRINDRRILSEIARSFGFAEEKQETVFIALDKLDKVGVAGVKRELDSHGHPSDAVGAMVQFLEALGTTDSALNERKKQLPDSIDAEVWQALVNVVTAISDVAKGRYNIVFDPTLVRGMGYYTGQIFEISCPGYSSSVAGGGRYDKMVGKFTGREVPACGFSIGFERIVSILLSENFKPPTASQKVALIFESDRDNLIDVLKKADALRSSGHSVCVLNRKKDFRKQLDNLLTQDFNAFASYKGEGSEVEVKPLAKSE